MKHKLFSLLLALLMSMTASVVWASDIHVDGIYYDFDSSAKTATVTYLYCASERNESAYSGNVVIPETVTYNGETYSVTSIGDWAFFGCTGMTSITIPESVTTINHSAFRGCTGLTSVTIPNSVTEIGSGAFRDCSGLTSVTIPNSVTEIGAGAFAGCSELRDVNLLDGESVLSLPPYKQGDDDMWLFHDCPLETLYLGRNLGCSDSYSYYYGPIPFYGIATLTSVTIGNNVKDVYGWAFAGCEELRELTICDGEETLFLGVDNYGSGTGMVFADCPLKKVYLGRNIQYHSHRTNLNDYLFYGKKTLNSVTIGNRVTEIGDFAFQGCTGLTSITIPNSVTTIQVGAFEGCTGLTSVTINCPYIGRWFSGNTSIKEVLIPNSVTEIGEASFLGCTGLTSITIPNSITSVGRSAFEGCSGLTSVTIGESVTSIGDYAFSGCKGLTSIEIPNSVTSIGGFVFQNCTGLTSATIPNNVTGIGWSAFRNCSAMTTVVIPNSVTAIGGSAFSGCRGLISVAIGNGVTSIDEDAFLGCTGLISVHISDLAAWCGISFGDNPLSYAHHLYMNGEEVKDLIIPNSVTSIGNYAFENCTGLTSVTIPNNVTSIGERTFSGCTGLTSIDIKNSVIGSSMFSGCTGLTFVTIPESVTSIGGGAFYMCTGLTSITIPSSVTTIGPGAFYGCSTLSSLKIGNKVASIGEFAFFNCKGMASVYIPNSVKTIGNFAFGGCTNLIELGLGNGITSIGSKAFADSKIRQLLIKANTPPTGSLDVFSEQTYYQTTLYVPIGKKDAYAYSDSWYKFSTIKESATANARATSEYAYTLMEARTFQYAAYDAVNDRIKMVAATSVDENNPNHCWQTVEMSGKKFLYNIGAKKFAVPSTDGSSFRLSETVGSISMEDGDDGIVIGGNTAQQWALVVDTKMDAYMGLEDVVATGVENLTPTLSQGEGAEGVYDLSGRRIDVNVNENVNNSKLQRGIYIKNGRKILVK